MRDEYVPCVNTPSGSLNRSRQLLVRSYACAPNWAHPDLIVWKDYIREKNRQSIDFAIKCTQGHAAPELHCLEQACSKSEWDEVL